MNYATRKPPIGTAAPDFHLPATDGHEYTLGSFAGKTVLVVIFTCNHCPYAQAYESRLVQLQADLGPRGVQLVAINANDASSYPEDNFDNMVRRAKQSGFNFPYLRDDTQHVARAYGTECTPEAYVLDAHRQVQYIGRIDDNWQHPEQVKVRHLHDAIVALLAGQAVAQPLTHAIGCSVKWKS